MGQYYVIVNLDKGEYLHPHRFNDGLKLLEFGSSGCATMLALAVLLADGNGRGGGDLDSDDALVGSWAGDRIVVAGDYADDGKWLTQEQIERYMAEQTEDAKHFRQHNRTAPTLYGFAHAYFRDVSREAIVALCADPYIRANLQVALARMAEWDEEAQKTVALIA